MSNQLKNETSPYLLQHAENPVRWYPWGREAFEKARAEDKPVFLSIGYSTCHWCHVMAHESFEDERTAELLNRYFVSIKVDREERPDIDSVYMAVCQAFTGSGGWPMSIFMTWEKKPFFAGTYFPVRPRYGMPGFSGLLTAIAAQWRENRPALLQSAEEIIAHLTEREPETEKREEEGNLAETAVAILKRSFDEINGGFGQAPKFPTPHQLLFLTLYGVQRGDSAALHMVEKTLAQMRRGGIFDQLGGGFSRYSTDARFLVPHFEKMLYDNALLIMAYAAAYHVTKKEEYLTTAKQTADYVLREMTAPEGGFYSAQDADSEGIEGKYYTFAWEEVLKVLGETRGKAFAEVFDITPEGNFEGTNIPNLLKGGKDTGFAEEKEKLYEYRKGRTKLSLDDKVLLSWNAMMIAALSMLFRVSKEERYLQAAGRAQRFLEKNLCSGLWLCTGWRDGKPSEHGFLCDYAYYIAALTELYHSTLEKRYLEQAVLFCQEAVKRFADRENGGYFLSEAGNGELFLNPKETYDGAVPSGNSMMAYHFVRLYQLTGKEEFKALADGQLSFLSGQARQYPAWYTMFLLAKLLYENPPQQITVVVRTEEELKKVKDRLPFLANVRAETEGTEYRLLNDKTTYYVCRNHACLPPVNEIGEEEAPK